VIEGGDASGVRLSASTKRSCDAPCVVPTSNVELVRFGRPGLDATSVYPVPAALTVRSPNVAVPATPVWVSVPARVAFDGLAPSAIVTVLPATTGLPATSRNPICTALSGLPMVPLVGCVLNTSRATIPGCTVAWNVTVLGPVGVVMLAVALDALFPTTEPNVSVADACPFASVVDALAIVPFTAVHVTSTPGTGDPVSSVTLTTNGAPSG